MKLETPPGTRDFLPEEMMKRQEVIGKVKATFERYGFSPAETPAFEYAELLEGKYGEEEKLIYRFEWGKNKYALRYDLTVPLVRMVASNQLPMPFKRYCIGPVWRGDNPQKGRYREFWQCDVDVIGVAGMKADAEVVCCAIDALESLGLKGFKFKINSRKVLDDVLTKLGIPKDKELSVFRALDKLEKQGEGVVRKELGDRGINAASVLGILKIKSIPELKKLIGDTEGVKELEEVFSLLKLCGKDKNVVFDLSMARGLDYYTGPIFEIELGGYGSIAGGGRYDKLIGQLAGKGDVPAVGISLGIERIIEVMREKGLLGGKKGVTKVFVLRADDESKGVTLQITQELRAAGINTDVDILGRNFSNQMSYANRLGVEKVVIVGQKDLKSGKVTIKDMKSGNQKAVDRKKITQSL